MNETAPSKALTVRQPWAAAIAHGPKRIENRTRRTHHRGTILIHSAVAEDRTARSSQQVPRVLTDGIATWPRHFGSIVAVAELVGCHIGNGCCTPWGWTQPLRSEPPIWHWELDDVRAVTHPVACRGQLGLWTPDSGALAAVRRQVRIDR